MSRVVVKFGGAVAARRGGVDPRLADAARGLRRARRRAADLRRDGRGAASRSSFVGGRRVTTPEALEVVRESLAGGERRALRRDRPARGAALRRRDRPAGDAGAGARPRRRAAAVRPRRGRRTRSRPAASRSSRRSRDGPLNVNADEAAAALAVGIGAERILFVTDVPGLLLGGAVAASIDAAEAERLLDAGALSGGIVPKLRAAIGAARSGVQAEIGETAVVA